MAALVRTTKDLTCDWALEFRHCWGAPRAWTVAPWGSELRESISHSPEPALTVPPITKDRRGERELVLLLLLPPSSLFSPASQ